MTHTAELPARAKTAARIMLQYEAWEPPAEPPADPVDYAWTAQVITDQAARIEALEAALKPFARVADLFKDRKPQHGDTIHAWEFTSGSAELRVSDCERARAALTPESSQ